MSKQDSFTSQLLLLSNSMGPFPLRKVTGSMPVFSTKCHGLIMDRDQGFLMGIV